MKTGLFVGDNECTCKEGQVLTLFFTIAPNFRRFEFVELTPFLLHLRHPAEFFLVGYLPVFESLREFGAEEAENVPDRS